MSVDGLQRALPPKGKTSSSSAEAYCWALPRSWGLPCAPSQALQNVSHAPSTPSETFPPAKLHPYLRTLLVSLGDDRPHGVIRILNRDFLDPIPLTPILFLLQVSRPESPSL